MLESVQNKVSYNVTDGVSVYPFPYPFFSVDDLVVYLTLPETPEEMLIRGRDYTVEDKESFADGGNVTLLKTAIPEESTLTIVRVISLQQKLNLPEFGKIPSTPVEQNFDRVFMVLQQFQEILDRVLTGEGVSGSSASANFQQFVSEFMNTYMLTDIFASTVGKVVAQEVADKDSALSRRVAELVDEFSKPYKYGLRKLFDVFCTFSTASPLGAIDLSLGATIDKWTYPEFYAEAIRRANVGAIPTVSEAAYAASLDQYGECPAFVINQANGTIRLPRIISPITPGDPGTLIQSVEEKFQPAPEEEDARSVVIESRKVPLRYYIQVFTAAVYNDAQVDIDTNSESIINAVGLGVM